MNSLRLRLELLLRRHGWLPVAALVLAAIGGWLGLVATPGLHRLADGQRRTLEILAVEARAAAVAEAPPQPLLQKRYGAFHDRLAARDAFPGILRTFFAEARKADLAIQQMDYKLEREKDGDYLFYEVSVPIKGSYSRIYGFAEDILVQVPSAALQDISFKRDNVGAASTEAKLRFAIYLKGGS